jgi:hypothetical protein
MTPDWQAKCSVIFKSIWPILIGYLEWQDIVHHALPSSTLTENKLCVCVCVCVSSLLLKFFYQFWGFKVCISHVSDHMWDQPNLLGTRCVKLITRLNLEPRLWLHSHMALLCHTSSWFGASSYKLRGVTYGPSESLMANTPRYERKAKVILKLVFLRHLWLCKHHWSWCSFNMDINPLFQS